MLNKLRCFLGCHDWKMLTKHIVRCARCGALDFDHVTVNLTLDEIIASLVEELDAP